MSQHQCEVCGVMTTRNGISEATVDGKSCCEGCAVRLARIGSGEPQRFIGTDLIVCPYCGTGFPDADYDYPEHGDDLDCRRCGRRFSVIPEFSVSFSSYPLEEMS